MGRFMEKRELGAITRLHGVLACKSETSRTPGDIVICAAMPNSLSFDQPLVSPLKRCRGSRLTRVSPIETLSRHTWPARGRPCANRTGISTANLAHQYHRNHRSLCNKIGSTNDELTRPTIARACAIANGTMRQTAVVIVEFQGTNRRVPPPISLTRRAAVCLVLTRASQKRPQIEPFVLVQQRYE